MRLLERDRQLAVLTDAWRDARRSDGRLVFVGAEAGAGKTSLAAALLGKVEPPARRLLGRCDGATTPRPLGPLIDVADQLRLDLPGPDEELSPARLFARLRSILAAQPSVLVLEDLHWADEATLDLVRHLGRRLPGLPVLIVATYRDDEVTRFHPLSTVLGDLASASGVSRLSLPALTPDAVATLVSDQPAEVDPASISRVTGGNPFFVTEVLAAGSASVPPTVRDAVLARAARLSDPGRLVLDAASVIGSSAELGLLLAVSGQPADSVDECVRRGMLVPSAADGGTRVAFRHELARDAIADSLAPGQRATLHRRCLDVVLAVAPAEHRLIVEHAVACADRDVVLDHAPLAAEQADRLGSHREAAELLRIALRNAESAAALDRAALLDRLSYQCYLTDQMAEALDARRSALALYERGDELGDDRAAVGTAQRWMSRLSWFLGRRADAEQYAELAVATLEPLGPDRELAMAYSNLSQVRMLADDGPGTLEWGRRAADLARAIGERSVETHALNNIGTALVHQGRVEEGLARLGQSLDLALADGLEEHAARAWTNLGVEQLTLRRLADADRTFVAGIGYCHDHDLDSWALYMSAQRAAVLLERGRTAEADRLARDVIERPAVSVVSRMPAATVVALIAVRAGRVDAAELVEDAWRLAISSGELQRSLPAALVGAEAAWTDGRPEAIAELTAEVWREARTRGDRWLVAELAWWRRVAGVTESEFDDWPGPFAAMIVGEARGAAEAWTALDRPFWSALALSGGDPRDTTESVGRLHRLDATATARAVQRELAARGRPVPRGPRAAARTNPAGLTARELDVLALLVDGCSDAEIAARLVLSERTVSHHVSAVLRKLDVPSRARAAAVGRELQVGSTVVGPTAVDPKIGRMPHVGKERGAVS